MEKASEDEQQQQEQSATTTTTTTTTTKKGGAIEGESLLLPLLQGLLDAPESDQPADSGTESGEDLRSSLIMEVQSALDKLSASLRSDSTDISVERRANLLHLVTKLQAGLSTQPPKTERRNSSSASRFAAKKRPRQSRHTVGVSSEELADARRLMEEIAFRDVPSANITPSTSGSRLITPSASQSSILQKQNSEGSVGQQSTSSYRSVNLSHHKSLVKNAVAKPFSNSTSGTSSSVETPTDPTDALHFLFANEEHKSPEVTYTETAQVQLRPKKVPAPPHRQSLTFESDHQVKDVRRPLSEAVTSEVDIKSVQEAVKQAARIKKLSETKTDEDEEDEEEEEEEESETEDEPTVVKEQQQRKPSIHEQYEEKPRYEQPNVRAEQPAQRHYEEQAAPQKRYEQPKSYNEQPPQKRYEPPPQKRYEQKNIYDEHKNYNEQPSQTRYEQQIPQRRYEEQPRQKPQQRDEYYHQPSQPKPDLILQTNPLYSQPSQHRNSKEMSPEEKYNRFSSKKMRMKRANTIDIPKPLNFYDYDDEEDSDCVFDQDENRDSYLGLRGPIHVGKLNAESKVPTFQPKTESDKKFLAFLSKHNENSANRNNIWTNKVHNWNNKFGNIKTAFEKVSQPVENVSNARNFWKSADDAVTVGNVTNHGPKISRQSARNLQEMFEQKQKQNESKTPWSTTVNTRQNVVTGSLKLDPKSFENKTHKFSQPSPPPVNQFTHAPQSAFKPIHKKTQASPPPPPPTEIIKSTVVDNSDTPLYLYCPKPLYSPTDSQSSSPLIHTKPFLQSGEHKVVNKAASKFEQVAQQQHQQPPPVQRKANKVFSSQSFQQPQPAQQLTAPYLVKRAESNNTGNAVRKLSDQYDSRNAKNDNYTAFSSVRQTPPKAAFGGQPHHYVPPIAAAATPKAQPLKQQKHHYTPQYNQPQQFIQPQSVSKPQIYRAKEVEKDQGQSFTSSYVYQPQKTAQQAAKPQTYQASSVQSQKVYQETPQKVEYGRQTSKESYKEYNAPVAKVMTGPVSQQAVTVKQKSPMSRDEHEMERAFSLRNALQTSTKQRTPTLSSGSFKTKYEQQRASRTPSPNPLPYRNESPRANFALNGKRLSMESVETNEDGEAIVTSRFSIPVVNVAPATPQTLKPPSPEQALSKSDSWHQICQQSQKPPSPSTKSVVKSKSLHTLAVPKLFEAGMTKEEMAVKKRTMEAFFGGGGSPQSLSKSNSRESLSKSNSRENLDKHEPVRNQKSSINRIKTSEKISIHRHSAVGLARSRTLPDIVCPEMLDESNVDKAFEDLFRSSS